MAKVNIEYLTNYMKEAGYTQTDIRYILTAFSTSYRLHNERQQNINPEQINRQCIHLIRTAMLLAKQALDADTLAAALMHDLLYSCNIDVTDLKQAFSHTVIQYLKGMEDFHNETLNYLKGKVTKSTQELIDSPVNPHVVLIGAAKRIDHLNRLSYIPNKDFPSYLDNTHDILIKLVEREGSIFFADQLSEFWKKCTSPETYAEYEEKYKRLVSYNDASAKETINFLINTFSGKAQDMSTATISHTKYMTAFHYNRRQIHNIYKHIQADLRRNIKQPFSKFNVPLFDCVLVFDNSLIAHKGPHSLIDEFLYIFNHYLRNHRFTIRDYLITNDDVPYFVIADRWENRLRLFLRTEKLYRKYQVGIIADEEHRFPNLTYHNNKGTVRIIVDSIEKYLPSGYSSLDYAFMISSSYGLLFQRMEIKNGSIDMIGNQILKNGDIGTLFLSDHITATFSWFKYVETDQAREHLINYFNNNYLESRN